MECQVRATAASTGATSVGLVPATRPPPTFQPRASWMPSSTSRPPASRMVARRHCLMEAHVRDSTRAAARRIRLAVQRLSPVHQRQVLGSSTRFDSLPRMLTSDRLSPRQRCRRQARHRPPRSQCLRHQDRLHHRRRQLHPAPVAAGGPHAVKSTHARLHLVGALSRSRNAPRLAVASGVQRQMPPQFCIRAKHDVRVV